MWFENKSKDAAVHALRAHVELRCWIIQPTGEGRAYFCKNAGASDGEWVRSLIHLSGKHFLPPSSHLAILLNAGLLSIHLLHSCLILSAYSLHQLNSPILICSEQQNNAKPDPFKYFVLCLLSSHADYNQIYLNHVTIDDWLLQYHSIRFYLLCCNSTHTGQTVNSVFFVCSFSSTELKSVVLASYSFTLKFVGYCMFALWKLILASFFELNDCAYLRARVIVQHIIALFNQSGPVLPLLASFTVCVFEQWWWHVMTPVAAGWPLEVAASVMWSYVRGGVMTAGGGENTSFVESGCEIEQWVCACVMAVFGATLLLNTT